MRFKPSNAADNKTPTSSRTPLELRYGVNETMISQFKPIELVTKLFHKKNAPCSVPLNPQDVHVLLYLTGQQYKLANSPLVEVSSPKTTICGDLHGRHSELMRIFDACDPYANFVFLGNYIDIGHHSLEVVTLLFALHLKAPKRMILLRGNHEQIDINKEYGFYAELRLKFCSHGPEVAESLFQHFNQVFSWMPFAAVVSKRVLCMHGGISPVLYSLDDIRKIPLPLVDVKPDTLAFDLLWANPDLATDGFASRVWKEEKTVDKKSMYDKIRTNYKMQMKGSIDKITTPTFGVKEVERVCEKLGVDVIIRSGQPVQFGYQVFPGNHLITIFSASRFEDHLWNYAAIAQTLVDNSSFSIKFLEFEPLDSKNECDAIGRRREKEDEHQFKYDTYVRLHVGEGATLK